MGDPLPIRSGLLTGEADEVTVPDRIIQEQENPQREKRKTQHKNGSTELAPAPPAELRNIRSAIDAIPPDEISPYRPWMDCIMAVKALGWEESLQLAHELSERTDGYDPEELDGKWETFAVEGDITIKTLFYYARMGGWVPEDEVDLQAVEPADLGVMGYRDSMLFLESCGASEKLPAALSITNRYSGMVPVSKSTEEFIKGVSESAPELSAPELQSLTNRLEWITSKRDEEARSLTAITRAVRRKHHYRNIGASELNGVVRQAIRGGITAVKAPHGVGKTQSIGKPFADLGQLIGNKVVAVCHRVSLTHELSSRLELMNYQDDPTQQEMESNGLGVCVNSIIRADLKQFCSEVQYLFIDEVSQVLRHIVGRACRDGNKVLDQLKNMIRDAEAVIVADADLNDDVIYFLEKCRPGEKIKIFESQPDESHLSVFWSAGENIYPNACGDILARLVDGQKLIVATDSRKKPKEVAKLVKTELPDKNVLAITAQNAGDTEQLAFLKDPEGESVKYDLVIYSPTISSGVSIQVEHFDHGFGLFFGSIPPSDAIQMIRRARRLTSWTLAFDMKIARTQDNAKARAKGLKQAAKLEGVEIVSFDILENRFSTWIAKGVNGFAANTIALLEGGGYRVERVSLNGDYLDAVVEIKTEVAAQSIEDILIAADINQIEADQLSQENPRSYSDQMALEKFFIRKALTGWGRGESGQTGNRFPTISVDDIQFYDSGRGMTQLRRYELAACFVQGREDAADKTASQRRYERLRQRAYRSIFSKLPIGLELGCGRYTAKDAAVALDMIMRRPHLFSFLGVVPHSVTHARPKDPVKFVGRVLKMIGLKADPNKRRSGRKIIREYELNIERLEIIRRYAQLRNPEHFFSLEEEEATRGVEFESSTPEEDFNGLGDNGETDKEISKSVALPYIGLYLKDRKCHTQTPPKEDTPAGITRAFLRVEYRLSPTQKYQQDFLQPNPDHGFINEPDTVD
ncbi:MAG: PriCT-2 domain-containing protein [Magnetococcales bacterium]|nr:PriCT-2 domain-containing protein [Magnetococcales bacterium]